MGISAWLQLRDTYNQKSEAEGICITILCGSSLVSSSFTNLRIENDSIDGQFAFCAMNRTVSSLFKQSISQKRLSRGRECVPVFCSLLP
jgi:hypothetical protein